MQLIERYIFRRVAVTTLATLVVVTTIVLSTQLLTRVAMVTRSADAFLTFLGIAAFLIPPMAMIVIPFALLVGVMRTMNGMNSDSELAVLEASGRSPAATARPAILMGLIMTVLSLGIAHAIEPWSNKELRATIARASADLVRAAAQSGTFQWVRNGSFIQIAEQLPGGEFGGIVIVDTTDPKSELIYHAKRGALLEVEDNAVFLLIDGQVQRRTKADNRVSIISFASTGLDFAQFSTGEDAGSDRPQEMSTPALLSPDPNNSSAQDNPAEIRREIHRRFTEWLYPMVFALIGIYFAGSAQTHRQQQTLRTASGALLALLLRTLGFVAVSNAGSSLFFAGLSYALPVGAIVVFSALILGSGERRNAGRKPGSGAGGRLSDTARGLAAMLRPSRPAGAGGQT